MPTGVLSLSTRYTVALRAEPDPALPTIRLLVRAPLPASRLDARGHPLEVTTRGEPWGRRGVPPRPTPHPPVHLRELSSRPSPSREPPAVAQLAKSPWLISEMPRR